MKRTILPLSISFLTFFFAFNLTAQVTITYDDFPRPAGFTDSVYRAVPANLVFPTEGENQVWDYSNLVPEKFLPLDFIDATDNPSYPGALNYRSNDLIFQSFLIESYFYEAVDQDGYYGLGRSIEDVSYSIAGISGGPNDTLRFPKSDLLYDGRIDFIQFPLNYGDQWVGTATERLPFELTVQGFGLNKTPGERRRYLTQKRKVVGSGKLIIPMEDGTPSPEIDALLIHVTRTGLDSVFLAGAPGPLPLMMAFGLTQGVMATDSFYIFYTPGFGAPIMDIEFGDERIFYRPAAARSVSGVATKTVFSASQYPNPVSAGGLLTIEMEEPMAVDYLQVYDLNGRLVFEKQMYSVEQSNFELEVPGGLPPGFYGYRMQCASSNSQIVGKMIIR